MQIVTQEVLAISPGIEKALQLLPGILHTISAVESTNNTQAIRYEPLYKKANKEPDPSGTYSLETEFLLRRCSLGVCQIMGQTARNLHFTRPLTMLFDPHINLNLAGEYLVTLRNYENKIRAWRWVLNAYNHGENWVETNPLWDREGYIKKYQALLDGAGEG